MPKIQRIPWLRILAEGAAVVASILLAFTIDAWWSERSARQAEIVILSSLHDEFVRNIGRIDEMDTQQRARDATLVFLEIIANQSAADRVISVPNEVLRGTGATPTFDAVTPILDGLVTSGRLDIIRYEDLLSSIALWGRMLIQLSESEQTAREIGNNQLWPGLMTRGNLRAVLAGEDPMGSTSFLVDDEMEGLIAFRGQITQRAYSELEELRSRALDVVAAIERAQAQ